MIYDSVECLIGHTPLFEPKRLSSALGLKGRLLLKLESFNPAGSAKDRAALFMINDAEETGRLSPGGTIIEPTSGNTGIALSAIGAARGYRIIIVMPDTMSEERRSMMKAYGAELVLTDGRRGMAGAIEKAEELQKTIPGSIIAGQFSNKANAEAHYRTTGPEIWEDAGGNVDIFVAGVGTGGTITGAGRYLREKNKDIHIIAVEPDASPVLSGGRPGAHAIQGIGAGFIPQLLDVSVYNDVRQAGKDDAFRMARLLAAKEGIFCGISSGAALSVAAGAALNAEGKTVVAVLPDSGDRYLSGELWKGEY